MRSKHRKKKIYILLPIGYSVLFVLLYFTGMNGLVKKQLADVKKLLITSTPQYQYMRGMENTEDEHGQVSVEPVGELICDSISMDVPLYYGDTDQILELGAGIYPGSALPDETGTTLIGAHDTTFFADLDQIKAGDKISIQMNDRTITYTVTKTKAADANSLDLSTLREDNSLILYTCYPLGQTNTKRMERYFVYAEK